MTTPNQQDGTQSGTGGTPQSGQAAPPVDPNATGTPPAQDPASGGIPPAAGAAGDAQPVTRAEFDALMARMQAADRRATTAENALKAHNDAQLSEAERAKQELEQLKTANAEKDKRIQDTALENAILADQTYAARWHNPATALSLIDRSLITFAEDGKPQGIKAALDKLVKEHPYLLKPEAAADGGDAGKGGSTGAPGTTPQGNGQPSRTELERKFPAMRGRVQAG